MKRRRIWSLAILLALPPMASALRPVFGFQAEEPAEAEQPNPAQAPQRAPRVQLKFFQLRGQLQPGAAAGDADEFVDLGDAATFVEDRTSMQILVQADKLASEGRYTEAVRHLGTILEGSEDYFFQPDPARPTHRSLKAEARRMIGDMPAEGRASYELQYGAHARQMLNEALADGDLAALAEVSRRFFHTDASYDATLILGSHLLDHGQPLAAALCFERLRRSGPHARGLEPMLSIRLASCWVRAGLMDKAQATLHELATQRNADTVRIAGEDVPLFTDDDEALAWINRHLGSPQQVAGGQHDRWLMFGGNAARNGSAAGGEPLLEPRWHVPTALEPQTEELVARLRRTYVDRNVSALPALHPLVVDDTVLMRTSRNLLAVDFETGKRLWEVPVDDSFDQFADIGDSSRPQNSLQYLSLLDQRMWDDLTYGTLSSDGRLVFSIEDLGFDGGDQPRPQVFGFNGRRQPVPSGPRAYNRLAAHEIRTGKLKWELGGPLGDFGLGQAGTFFLGPPLPLSGRLYVLSEQNGEIRLLALDAETGGLDWSQQLAVVENDILRDQTRRLAGVSPSYADGVLVCPTAAGAAVAVDVTTRSLLWGYRFPTVGAEQGTQFMAPRLGGVMMMRGNSQSEAGRWADSGVHLADGRALLTPIESDELHCLDLIDGTVIWKRPRGKQLYLACIHEGVAVLVGQVSVQALRLSDGEPAWPQPATLGGLPSGYGFLSGTRYYIPLTTAEVVAVNVLSGKIESRTKARRDAIPGNLIAYNGHVLSQGVDGVANFFQIDSLEQEVTQALAARADDPVALAQRGELRLHQGAWSAAIDDLRRSHALAPDPRTRELLVDALLEGLESDFATNQDVAAEIATLVERPENIVTFHRIMAQGLHKQGQHLPALEAYLKLADSAEGTLELEPIDEVRSVRRDRWVQAGIASLVASATSEEREQIEESITARLEEARADESPEPLRRFLRFFSQHPLADTARIELAGRLQGSEALLEIEFLLRRLEDHDDATVAAPAVARLARMLYDAGRLHDAQPYLDRLADQWADVVCLDGKTGAEWAAGLRGGENHPDLADATSATWPRGKVETTHLDETNANHRYFACEIEGPRGPFFRDMTVEIDHGQALLGRDGLGRVQWRLPLSDAAQSGMQFNVNPGIVRAKPYGHLLLLSLGEQVLALDTLNGLGSETVRVLWTRDVADSLPGVAMNRGIHANQIALPWGGRKSIVADSYGRPIGQLGPTTNNYVCFLESQELVAVDPLSGQTLWTRTDIEAGSDLFGDEQYVFVVAPNSSEALVLDALDGRELARRTVPPGKNRMTTRGRHILAWDEVANRQTIQLIDPWYEETLWEASFGNARCEMLDQEVVGVVDQERFVLLDLADGRTLIDSPIEPQARMHEIFLLGSSEHYLLITNSPTPNRNGVFIRAMPGGLNRNPLINGHVYSFDRETGERLWTRRLERQGLLLDQPRELPIVCFSSIVYERQQQQRHSQHVSLLCLDKRNGQTVYQEQLGSEFGTFELEADPAEQFVDLRLLRKTVRMQFTSEPWDEVEPVPAEETPLDEQQEAQPDELDEAALPPAPARPENALAERAEAQRRAAAEVERMIAEEKAKQRRATLAPRESGPPRAVADNEPAETPDDAGEPQPEPTQQAADNTP